jgi:hypothetical protein
MASNVKEYLTEKVQASKYYSIQLDGSTDVSNTAHFLHLYDLKTEIQ